MTTKQVVSIEWDHQVPGLGVRHNKSGALTYICKYYFSGKAYSQKLAPFELLTIQQARDIVRKIKHHATNGIDPRPLWPSFLELVELPKNNRGITWKRMRKIYVIHARETKSSWKKDESRLRRHTAFYWDNRSLFSITNEDVKTLFKKLSKTTPIEANHLLEDISSLYRVAKEQGFLSLNHANPTHGIKRNKKTKGIKFIRKDQMAKIAAAIHAMPKSYQLYCIMLDFYLGLRISPCKQLRWDWIDFEQEIIYLPASVMKNGEEQNLALTAPAKRLLEQIPRKDGSPFVFPGKSWGAPIATVQKQWAQIRKAAGCPNLTVHSIRHTVGSWLQHQTGDLKLVGEVLHHKSLKSTEIYANHFVGTVRSPFEIYALSVERYLSPEALETSPSHQQDKTGTPSQL